MHEIRNRSCTKNEAPEPQLRGTQPQPSTSARYGVRLSYALVDAAMPPITRAGLFHASKIWIDDARGSAARCRRVALRQRRVAAFVIVGAPLLVNMQANRISRIVRLGPNRCRRQNRRNRQNRQSRNAHQSLLRDIRAESSTKRDAIPHQSAPDAGRQGQRAPMALPIIVTAIVRRLITNAQTGRAAACITSRRQRRHRVSSRLEASQSSDRNRKF
jgi:hypothetical protein